MKKYHGENAKINGDEISLHYHTFKWTDYNKDGFSFWNQSLSFMECYDDFNFTLAQFLIEEEIFPVSFRSGWHYMDNDWQHYLNELLPYSMHNAWPSKRVDEVEPLDNTYDWSLAPEEFVPYHPAVDNYQIPGNSPGWDLRSAHLNQFKWSSLMNDMFQEANSGNDQMACIWGHLPETNFIENIVVIDSLAHKSAQKYPDVKFKYCTAIEAMQLWQGNVDTIPPVVNITEIESGNNITLQISTDEQIFQKQPFVAVKDIYERYYLADCNSTGQNSWETTTSLPKDEIAKIGIAVCDTLGNQTLAYVEYLSDDIYIDNLDDECVEVSGNWSTSSNCSWGTDSKIAEINPNESAVIKYYPNITQTGLYNTLFQIPDVNNLSEKITFKIFNNSVCVDTIFFTSQIPSNKWIYISTNNLTNSGNNYIEVKFEGAETGIKKGVADVIKVSSLIRDRSLEIEDSPVKLGRVSASDSLHFNIEFSNRGINDLTIQNIKSKIGVITTSVNLPIIIPPMSNINIPFIFYSDKRGSINENLLIVSNDPLTPRYLIPVEANVTSYFVIIDNEDSLNYSENGNWFYSVAQANGPSSRYAWLNQNSSASFFTKLKSNGIYEISEIVPTTVNASNNVLYEIWIGDKIVDSIHVNQNDGSGGWVSLWEKSIPANTEVEIKVIDTGLSTVNGVLRADAILFELIQEISEFDEENENNLISDFKLNQNYPNPFNPTTTIQYQLPKVSDVKITIYNILGEKIHEWNIDKQNAGTYSVVWDGLDKNDRIVSSGTYIYKITAGEFTDSKKLVFLK
ncbi:MAG: T9SS type A sorting domain-containing protein, partial [Candidatus Marinimicrobia bacterium]|nr:T9SS type A sorting domain-containing protein [Candidatus Neomarinimicrobiota bacterium]